MGGVWGGAWGEGWEKRRGVLHASKELTAHTPSAASSAECVCGPALCGGLTGPLGGKHFAAAAAAAADCHGLLQLRAEDISPHSAKVES